MQRRKKIVLSLVFIALSWCTMAMDIQNDNNGENPNKRVGASEFLRTSPPMQRASEQPWLQSVAEVCGFASREDYLHEKDFASRDQLADWGQIETMLKDEWFRVNAPLKTSNSQNAKDSDDWVYVYDDEEPIPKDTCSQRLQKVKENYPWVELIANTAGNCSLADFLKIYDSKEEPLCQADQMALTLQIAEAKEDWMKSHSNWMAPDPTYKF